MTEAQILSQANTVCALSDLGMGLAVLPAIFALARCRTGLPGQKKWWLLFFIALDASCLLGFVTHYFFPEWVVQKRVWYVLTPLLMETVVLFALTGLCNFHGESRPNGRETLLWHGIGAASVLLAYALTAIFHLENHIVPLTAFMTAVGICGFALFIRSAVRPGRTGERLILSGFLPILAGACIEMRGNILVKVIWYFNQDTVMHLCTTLGIGMVFFGVLKVLKKA